MAQKWVRPVKNGVKAVAPGLPILDSKMPKDALQLFGRIFLVLLFCTLLHFSQDRSKEPQIPDGFDAVFLKVENVCLK